jgi:hypothetical protein
MKIVNSNAATSLARLTASVASLAALMTFAGCSDGMARVKGQVTLDGQPVHGGKDGAYVIVQFLPASGVGPNGAAVADQNGRYSIGTGSHYGVVPGDYVVACTFRPANPDDPVPDRKFSDPKTSGMKCTARSGNNEFNISLETPPKSAPRSGA